MSTAITAVFEGGVLRPTAPLQLPEGSRVELIVVSAETTAPTDGQAAAAILARIAALSTANGDPHTSARHDAVLYGGEESR